jgi:hypothetical protein
MNALHPAIKQDLAAGISPARSLSILFPPFLEEIFDMRTIPNSPGARCELN